MSTPFSSLGKSVLPPHKVEARPNLYDQADRALADIDEALKDGFAVSAKARRLLDPNADMSRSHSSAALSKDSSSQFIGESREISVRVTSVDPQAIQSLPDKLAVTEAHVRVAGFDGTQVISHPIGTNDISRTHMTDRPNVDRSSAYVPESLLANSRPAEIAPQSWHIDAERNIAPPHATLALQLQRSLARKLPEFVESPPASALEVKQRSVNPKRVSVLAQLLGFERTPDELLHYNRGDMTREFRPESTSLEQMREAQRAHAGFASAQPTLRELADAELE